MPLETSQSDDEFFPEGPYVAPNAEPMHTLWVLVGIDTTGKRDHVETVVQRELDHRFRGRVQVHRVEFTALTYDPVIDDGHPPKDYTPHAMPVVDHRGQQR